MEASGDLTILIQLHKETMFWSYSIYYPSQRKDLNTIQKGKLNYCKRKSLSLMLYIHKVGGVVSCWDSGSSAPGFKSCSAALGLPQHCALLFKTLHSLQPDGLDEHQQS